MPIRLRLALASALAMTVLLTIAGSFLYWRLASDLSRSLNQELRQRAADLSVVVGSPGRPLAGEAGSGLVERGEDFAEFVTVRPSSALRILAEMGERMRQTNELMSRQVSRNVEEEVEERLTFGQRVADGVARFGGSWGFIFCFGGVMAAWMLANAIHPVSWDAYPYILLNLCLSTIAALQAPVIMMSQNRQDAKDRLRGELDYRVNLKAEVEISRVLDRLDRVEDQLDAVLSRGAAPGGPRA